MAWPATESDIDRRGIYLPPADLHWSLYGVPEQLENDETQEAYWELQKFLVLALKANPNVLECLYTPMVEKATPLAEKLLAMRSIFLSRMVYQTYNGYVLSQFKKMQADLRNQGQVKWKHVMHLIRLLLSGISILRDGFVPVRVEEHRDKLLAIRRGEMPWEEVEDWRQASAPRIQRRLGGDEAAGAPGLREGQCVSDRGPPLGAVGGPAMMNDARLLKKQVEQHPYPLLFATISGAHLYGFPSPDSDLRPARRPSAAAEGGRRPEDGPGDGREVGRSRRPGNRSGHARRQEVLRPAAQEERLRAGAGLVAARRPHDAGTRGTEGDRQELHHPAPCPSLPRLCGNAVEAVPEGEPAARQAAPVCVPGAADRHSPDADRRGRGEPGSAQRDGEAAVPRRPDRAEGRRRGERSG